MQRRIGSHVTMIENLSGKQIFISDEQYSFYDDRSEQRSLLRRAAINGNIDVLRREMLKVPEKERSKEFGIALFDALESDILIDCIINELLSAGADLQVQRKFDKSIRTGRIINTETALMRALRHPQVNLKLVTKLVEAGASVHERDELGHSVIAIAVHHADAATVKYLLDKGASCYRPYDYQSKSVLMHACKPGHNTPEEQVKIVETVLKRGAASCVNDWSKRGYTPLMFAIDAKKSRKHPQAQINLDVVKLLL
jgi:ankyrin repeat protein